LQLGLTAATLMMLFAVLALVIATYATANAARSAFEAGYVLSDLANVQRGVYRLEIMTERVVRRPTDDRRLLKSEAQMLQGQVRRIHEKTASNPSIQQGLARLDNILSEYLLHIQALEDAEDLVAMPAIEQKLISAVVRLEREAENLYDQEEARFFGRIRRVLNRQGTSQAVLLVTCTLLLFFGVMLALSLRRSVSQEFERAYTMLEALYGADEELHRHLRTEAVFQALVDVVVEVFGADKSSLLLWDDQREMLTCVAARGYNPVTVQAMQHTVDDGLIGLAARTGRPVVVEDTYKEPKALKRIIIPENIRAVMHMPIQVADKLYGMLTVCFTHPRSFDADDLRLVHALSHRAASAIENARLYEQVEQAATAEERQRLARELHDAVTQTLFSASLIADVLPRIWERSAEQGMMRLAELRELTRGALAEMRTLLLELRPSALMDAELPDLLHQLAEATNGRARLPVYVVAEGEPHCVIPPDVKVAIYRVAQEALNNVVKHSQATQATVTLSCEPGQVRLTVQDDGRGFDPAQVPANHLGLGIMHDRAGAIGAQVTIHSNLGEGSCVEMVWQPPKGAGAGA
jgi:signal transduction histidine kinase